MKSKKKKAKVQHVLKISLRLPGDSLRPSMDVTPPGGVVLRTVVSRAGYDSPGRETGQLQGLMYSSRVPPSKSTAEASWRRTSELLFRHPVTVVVYPLSYTALPVGPRFGRGV